MASAEPGLATYVESWNPSAVVDEDLLSSGPVAALSALLDRPGPVATHGEPVPPLWHWLYFRYWVRQDALGRDGHPSQGHFLPPIPDRQRMFAGGRVEVEEPLRLGEATERTSELKDVTVKHGSTGELVFVTERHELRQGGRVCLREEQDLVYRSGRAAAAHPSEGNPSEGNPSEGNPGEGDPSKGNTAAVPELTAPWQLAAQPDPPLLFRFSALTVNSHRIHYDRPYARDIEGYPELVVHGPLLILLMLELPRRHGAQALRSASYRLRSPVFAGEALAVGGTPANGGASLQVATHRDSQHATAEVRCP